MTHNTFAKWSLAAMLVCAPAFAEKIATATIPFDFHVGRTKMPAGDYVVRSAIPGSIQMVRADSSVSAFILVQGRIADAAPNRSSLIFNRYGDNYFLSQVWRAGDARGKLLPQVKLEQEAARAAATHQQVNVLAGTRKLPPVPR